MKSKYLLGLIILSLAGSQARAQSDLKELDSGYYMTVAAYLASGEDYAIRYTDKLAADGFDANYGFTFRKNMYFVYIKRYNNFKQAVGEINSTRKSTPFDDAWVYVYQSINPEPHENKSTESGSEQRQKPNVPVEVVKDTVVSVDESIVTKRIFPIVEPEPDDGSRPILIETVETRTQNPIEINFTVYDPNNEKIMASVKSWQAERIKPPWNANKIVRLSIDNFGWQKDEVSFNFENPVTDSTSYFTKMVNDTVVIFFEMRRLQVGDFQTLYNVYFMKDASIMLPDSKFQLEELLDMLNENPEYRIRLHGHTNGTSGGEYYRLSENDTLYFSMSKNHEMHKGSAKQLSIDRANTVKRYLVSRGIAENRIELKGWGGKKMIYDENSSAAPRNIRVEVEVLE